MIRQIGRYRIEEEIGRGGMAVVYRAQDEKLERYVALKLLAAHLEDQGTVMERFAQEARIIASLEHPHIVTIYDYGVYKRRPYLVMRHLRGGTFRERLGDGSMTMDILWPISMQIAAALDDAHDHGVIHRDIKPSNLLFDNYDRIYVSDFGVAKIAGNATRITKRQRILGTPAYMSPEQCSEVETDGRSDQYSLAIVLFEALAGQPPFSGDTMQLIYKHTHEPPPRLHEINESLPPALSAVLVRALSKAPEERYPTVTAFVTSLQQSFLTAESRKPGEIPPVVLADGTTYVEPVNADFSAGRKALDRDNWRVALRYFSRVGPSDPYYGRAIRYKREARRQLKKTRPQPQTQSTDVTKSSTELDADKPRSGFSIAALLFGRDKVDGSSKLAASRRRVPVSTTPKPSWSATLRQVSIALLAFLAILVVAILIVAGLGGRGSSGDSEEASPGANPTRQPESPEPTGIPAPAGVEETDKLPLESAPSLFAETAGSGARWRKGEDSEAIVPGERVSILLSPDEELSIVAGQEPLMLELPSGERLFLDSQTDIIFQAVANSYGSDRTSIVIRQGRLVADAGDQPLHIANYFGAGILTTGSVIGVLASTAPHRFHAACLLAESCEVIGEGEEGNHVFLQGGQYSEVGGQGVARPEQPVRVELFSDLSGLVPTATATTEPTATPRPTETPTATTQPRLPTLTPIPIPSIILTLTVTPVGDLDLDGVPDDIDQCPGQYGPGDRKGCPKGDE